MHRLLDEPVVAQYSSVLGRENVKRAVEQVLDRARASGETHAGESLLAAIAARLEELRLTGMVPVVNATGVILHTNLGRAPVSAEALEAVARFGGGYSNLEYDLALGERGSRYARLSAVLREVTGAQDALVVNNGAAAVLLVLDTLAKGREVVVGRNQLVEIGGGFRIPDVLERSGAVLVEVGTTNRVYLSDFERALSPRTALMLRTHPSNFHIEGFTHDVGGAELVKLGRRAGVPAVEDLGSGALVDLAHYGLPHERTVQEALADGFELVTFSGDKLVGGPQAGIIAGSRRLIARLRANPLLRALRVDKMTIAALGATLEAHRDPAVRNRIPLFAMLAATLDDLRARAQPYLATIAGSVSVEAESYVGGGSLPQARIASLAIALPSARPDLLAAALRRQTPAIVARVEQGRLLFDLRTIAPAEDAIVIAAVARAAGDPTGP